MEHHFTYETERIARQISGTWDWNGVQSIRGDAGLVKEVQKFLNTYTKTRDLGMFAIEYQQDEEISEYWICWDKAIAQKANKEYRIEYQQWQEKEEKPCLVI